MTLLLTSDEGHHKQRQCYVGLEILLLAFRTSRIFTETGLRLNLLLNLCHNCFSI